MRALSSPAQSAQAITMTRRTQATTWGASPRFLLLPAPTSTSTSPLAFAHACTNSSFLTTAPYTRGHRPSTSSTLALDARLANSLTALVSRRAFMLMSRPPYSLSFSPSRLAPHPARSLRISALCAHAAFCGRRLGAGSRCRGLRTRGVAIRLDLARAGSRAPDGSVPPKKKEIICTHLTEKPARQHVKAREGVPESVTQGVLGARAHVCKAALGKNASPRRLEHPRRVFGLRSRPRIDRQWHGVLTPCPVRCCEERLPDPPRVARAQNLRTRRTFDLLHASPARGVVVACTLARSVRGLRTRSQQTAPATLVCVQLVPSRVARAAVCTRACRVAPSPLARIGLALLVGNARAASIII
ncbi:hypothetical protein C8J57DRAFT_1537393 [Mycena rebaudengoi]|nr:hypothetical protein C8J57DRAFT_1537393 [Mycena rebaudengoi]